MIWAPYGEIIPELKRGDYRPYRRTNHALSHCTTITIVDFAHYGVSRAKDWVLVDCGTMSCYSDVFIRVLAVTFSNVESLEISIYL